MTEFVPILHFHRIFRLWWIVVLVTFLGGILGYVAYRLRSPIYEATAVFYVTIDFDKVEGGPLSQYDEDLALSVMQQVLYYSPEIHSEIAASPAFEAAGFSSESWFDNIILEREHAFWKIRVRSNNAEASRDLVNQWAELGSQEFVSMKEQGKIPDYVVIETPVLAELPQRPVHFGMNQLILAGSLIGFVIGILLSDELAKRTKWSQVAA